MRNILLLPHILIHNANALSSPYTIGFPAMTAWLGATHALQRMLNQENFDISFSATGVINHQLDLQTYRGMDDYVSSIVSTGNPLDKSGSRPAFIEEARCHIDASIIIELSNFNKDLEKELLEKVSHLLHAKMKIAGGDIKSFNTPEIICLEDGNDVDMARLARRLMPGYAIIERRELMLEEMTNSRDAIDAMLDYLKINHHCEEDESGNIKWHSQRKTYQDKSAGWIVPIATGFQGISDITPAKNQRDPDKKHRFAESLVTLGEFKMPYRFHSIDEMLWHYHFDKKNDLYLCQQNHNSLFTTSPSDNSITNEFE